MSVILMKIRKVLTLSSVIIPFFFCYMIFINGCESLEGLLGKDDEGDTTPPEISITSPGDGATVSGSGTISATATDNGDINNVLFYVDGDSIGSVSDSLSIASGTFETLWNSFEYANGEHTVFCKAVDNAGNEALSDTVQVNLNNTLFTATFTNEYLSSDAESIVLISHDDGSFIAMQTFVGDDNYTFPIPEDLSPVPNHMSITLIELYADGSVEIVTNLKVPVGSSWTWGKLYPEIPDYVDATLNFSNVPENNYGRLVGPYNSYTYYSNYDENALADGESEYMLRGLPADIYLRLDTPDGPKYDWQTIVAGGNDWSLGNNMNNPSARVVDLNDNLDDMRFWFYGFPEGGQHYDEIYRLDYQNYSDTTVNSINAYYPPGKFQEYRLSIREYTDAENNNYTYYQSTYGDLPTEYSRMDADFDYINDSPIDFELSVTGSEALEIVSYWYMYDSDYNYGYWDVYGPSDYASYTLPEIPGYISTSSLIDRENYEQTGVNLIGHSNLDSYYDILELIFESPDLYYNVADDVRTRYKYPINSSVNRQNIGSDIFTPDYDKLIGDPIYKHYKRKQERQTK